MSGRICLMTAWLLAIVSSVQTGICQDAAPLTAQQTTALQDGLQKLQADIAGLSDRFPAEVADAAIFAKGLEWALRYDSQFKPADVKLLEKAFLRGSERSTHVSAGRSPWLARKGRVVLGYVSRVDGSVQPYGLIIPENYDPNKAWRLDVVLHGSTRPVGLSELRFMSRFDGGDETGTGPNVPYLELHPLGRVENCYRWAGETDVFECIEDVCRRFHIDRERIVLRGMSMGASGTWHLGLKHPDRFVALGPYCGYVDTHRFSETPLASFVKVGPLPPHQERTLHMLDSVDYAANAGIVPAIACIGEKDVFFQAHVIMGEAMKREGLEMVNLISPGTGHVIDPVTHAEQMRRIAGYTDKGLDRAPRELRFVTWTLKYGKCHWLQILGLEQHYARAEFAGRIADDRVEITTTNNITRFAILTADLPKMPKSVRIGETDLPVPESISAESPGVVVTRTNDGWEIAGEWGTVPLTGKRPGLQGPIDDAFAEPFLCVRGTGKPWNETAQIYSNASLDRFAEEWRHYFRGELPIKNDTDVTEEDVQTRHLILFGDPGSNPWIAKTLPHLPFTWTKQTLQFGGQDYPAASHLPALISPNPLSPKADRYIVYNSGHTFREAELAKLNYLLFPRWGDWAILDINTPKSDAQELSENVRRAGFFNEFWQLTD